MQLDAGHSSVRRISARELGARVARFVHVVLVSPRGPTSAVAERRC